MQRMKLDRRQFLICVSSIAGGFAIGLRPSSGEASSTSTAPWGPDSRAGNEMSAWIEIAADDTVTIRVPTPEIGNGAMTQVAMNVAEELACDWSRVKVTFCSIHRDHIEKGVYNSGFLPFFGGHGTDKVRMKHAMQLGASARERLKAAAAEKWRVPVADIEARESVLIHKSTGRRLRYGEVAVAAARVTLAAEPSLKPQSEWTLIGKKSLGKLNTPEIVSGKATFGIDVKLPGMVHAALLQAPVHGGTLKSHKPEAVLGMPGVRAVVVVDPSKTKGSSLPNKATWPLVNSLVQSGVAVIADHYWQAKMALDALPIEWNAGPGAQWTSEEQIYATATALHDKENGVLLRKAGDVHSVTGETLEGTYSTPYCENAALEPLNGTALVTKESCEVWCPTQDMLQAYWVVIDETGMAPEQVKLHQTYVGGRFGRGTQGDDVRMAVAVAKEYPGVPVKTIWSRAECFKQGRFRTPIISRFKAVFDKDGYPSAVTSKAVFVGTQPLFQLTLGYDDMPYFTSGVIPNVLFSTAQMPMPILNGAYRGPCFNSHAFCVETFIDECAAAAKIDPLEYRLKLVSKWDKPWADCLRIAANKSGWGNPLPKGQGRGIAITSWPAAAMHNTGTIICAVARVKVSQAGELTVEQVDISFDCGRVANPDAVRAQIEGGTLFGMNMTLNEQLTIKAGTVAESSFAEYPLLRLGDKLPPINIHFDALSGHERFDIVGEAPVGPIGPAIGNAIFQATGKRLRSTPFRRHDLSWT